MPAHPLKDIRFHAVSLVVAVVAGVATYGTLAVMLPASAMFLGWVAYNLAGASARDNLADLGCFLLGLAFGIGTAIAIRLLTPTLGDAATPLAVSGVVVLVLSLRTLAPLNNPIAYFLGLTSFFYSGLAPVASTYAILACAAVIGAASCAAATLLQAAVQPQAETEAQG
ncbi:DUF1097 domain-containing protein [Sphingomonas sp. PR090111-T3T-6A]|uniref:DUF1097 domain-containing protein n=1 Tax=Sphingomonas sp. PR090111-T3T-6A TaxID=685778 RepID=UPI00036D9B60|nr:DUF1097 domain-containing protein [Sphingomonas sp. PR090111-T3T-6A]